MANILVLLTVFLLSTIISTAYSQSTPVNPGCNPDQWRQNTCFYYMTKGYCTDKIYSGIMKNRCSAVCGYCCPDGTLSQKPFNEGCQDSGFCADMDRLPRLVNVTSKKTCLKYRNDTRVSPSSPWVKYYCESTFGWCCMDKKTFSDGPEEKGCSYKLCYNLNSDEYCLNQTQTVSSFCDTALTRHRCAWTCKNCKAQKPRDCGVHGCCWNGVPSTRPDHRDCPYCRDLFTHTCNQFRHGCVTGQYRLRNFAFTSCPVTCKMCVKKK